ncbi:MAG TPA: chemotaxis protein CheW [Clostridia bacterium]|nr:chemotaxis protein CheW [Clostridia bacterium]
MNFLQMVIFSLDQGEYGIDISCVQEIIRIPERITKIPNVPSYINGMFNLRGKVIYAIDLKERFQLDHAERGADSRLLILKLEELMVGVIVDDVSDVLRVSEELIENLSSEIGSIGDNSVKGICKTGDRLILVLDEKRFKSDIFQSIENDMEEKV